MLPHSYYISLCFKTHIFFSATESLARSHKSIPEIFLTRLLSTKGTVQKFVDDFFGTILKVPQNFPPPVKWLFDILDEAALQNNVSSPEVRCLSTIISVLSVMLQKRMFSSQLFHPFQTLWAPTCNLVQDIICLNLVRDLKGSGLYQQLLWSNVYKMWDLWLLENKLGLSWAKIRPLLKLHTKSHQLFFLEIT